MAATTSIEWTTTVHPDGTVTAGKTWNPVRGCSVVSPGCHNCYAMKQAHRFSGARIDRATAGPHKHENDRAPKVKAAPYAGLTRMTTHGPQWTGKIRTIDRALLEPLSWRKPARVFVNSMSDLFHEGVPDEFIDQVFAIMAVAPHHSFQVLTKRAGRMRQYCSNDSTFGRVARLIAEWTHEIDGVERTFQHCADGLSGFHLKNVWLGVSVENQQYADERIPMLLQTPAALRFISAEPLLGPIDCRFYTEVGPLSWLKRHNLMDEQLTERVDWVIIGGESGPKSRPFDLEWARSLIQECKAAGVPVFMKQLGAKPESVLDRLSYRGSTTRKPDGFYRHLRDRKGGDMAEWPTDLRVREYPNHASAGVHGAARAKRGGGDAGRTVQQTPRHKANHPRGNTRGR